VLSIVLQYRKYILAAITVVVIAASLYFLGYSEGEHEVTMNQLELELGETNRVMDIMDETRDVKDAEPHELEEMLDPYYRD